MDISFPVGTTAISVRQAAEERSLAGVCGSPVCRNRLAPKARLERLKPRVQQGEGISVASEAFCR